MDALLGRSITYFDITAEKFSSEMEEDDSTPVKAICPDVDHEEVVQMSDCGWRQWRSLVELGM